MKRFAIVLLAVVLMLSLSVCSFADTSLILSQSDIDYNNSFSSRSSVIVPYSLVTPTTLPVFISSYTSTSNLVKSQMSQDGDIYVGSGAITISPYNDLKNGLFFGRNSGLEIDNPMFWFNFIGKITDSNGYVLQSSDFSSIFCFNCNDRNIGWSLGSVSVASDNTYQFDDGYIQLAVCKENRAYDYTGYLMAITIINPNVVGPFSFEVEVMDVYCGETSSSNYPFDFGPNAHNAPSAGPKDPNDSSQYGSASDQVEWYNDAFGGAVDPELDNKIVAGNDMLLQQEEIEQDVIADFQQYSSQVDPANITFPTAVLNGMSFIGTTFMSSYNNLGDISFVISLSMMIGVVLALIGRGEGALAREKANVRYERRRDENRAYYEQMRNKK